MRQLFIGSCLLLALCIVGVGQVAALSTGLESQLITKGRFQWLSPVHSLNLSYDEMESFIKSPNNPYYGLRFAKCYEVEQLLVSYGINADKPSSGYIYNLNKPFLTDFAHGYQGEYLNGWIYDEPYYHDNAGNRYGSWSWFHLPTLEGTWELIEPDTSTCRPDAGNWLVRAVPVPEPSSMLLLGFGVLGLSWYGWKRKKA